MNVFNVKFQYDLSITNVKTVGEFVAFGKKVLEKHPDCFISGQTNTWFINRNFDVYTEAPNIKVITATEKNIANALGMTALEMMVDMFIDTDKNYKLLYDPNNDLNQKPISKLSVHPDINGLYDMVIEYDK